MIPKIMPSGNSPMDECRISDKIMQGQEGKRDA
jgi:hypothetical protein